MLRVAWMSMRSVTQQMCTTRFMLRRHAHSTESSIKQKMPLLQAGKRLSARKRAKKSTDDIVSKVLDRVQLLRWVMEKVYFTSLSAITFESTPRFFSHWTAVAYCTAEEYNLDALVTGLYQQGLYQSTILPEDVEDVLHVCAKYQVDNEPREAFIFREGSVVFWNVPEIERFSVIKFLKKYCQSPHDDAIIKEETEALEYTYTDTKTRLSNGKIYLGQENSCDLEKFTFSNVMALSVQLAIWESTLEKFVESIEHITEDMKQGRPVKLDRGQVIKKMGELFALRHFINLSSDLLDTPDFYWEREALEPLYLKTYNYLSIAKRTKVMNEKLNHCNELMQLINDHLNDQHHVRLEWMIIVLITVEVLFEVIHYTNQFL